MAMRLESIVRKAVVPFLVAGTIATTSVLGACAQPEPVNPPVVIPAPEPTLPPEYTPTPKPTTPEPIPVEKPFELVGDNLTAEQYKTFHDNSLEDYLKVLDVYGINKEDARLKIAVGETGYGVGFYFGSEYDFRD